MGHDKAALEIGGRTLLERALAVLRPACDELLLATGSVPRYAESGVPIVLDRAEGLGPLAGLEAALAAARYERVLVIAVDMPAVEPALLLLLVERAEREDCDALLLGSALGVEPLCGVYHTRLLPAVRAALDARELRMTALFTHPMTDGRLPRIDTFDAASAGHAAATQNVNTSAEFDRARTLLASAGELAAPAHGGHP